MTPQYTFPSDWQERMVTWRVPWQVPLGLLCWQTSHSPAGEVWATQAGLSYPLDCGQCTHTVTEHTLCRPVGTQCQCCSSS